MSTPEFLGNSSFLWIKKININRLTGGKNGRDEYATKSGTLARSAPYLTGLNAGISRAK
jgi:hypothetical protein